MKNKMWIFCISMLCFFTGMGSLQFSFAASHVYTSKNIANTTVKYITLDMADSSIKPAVVLANGKMCSTQSLSSMAKSVNAFSAINGTYFEAYNGTPVPWGTIIKEGKVLHIGQGGAVMGITDDNQLLVDRLKITLTAYANGSIAAYPWRINHPSSEDGAITVFTAEYGSGVTLQAGAKAVIVKSGIVSAISSSSFSVPSGGFAIVFNKAVAGGAGRFEVGDSASYEESIQTTYTQAFQWESVVAGLGAGPSLIINGKVTANGQEEGFTEAKINTNRAGRSFIGATKSGKIVIGNMGGKTLKEAASICESLNLVNAMCLDGGGSIGLYDKDAGISIQGRNINNGLAFLTEGNVKTGINAGTVATPARSEVIINGETQSFESYTIENNTYFKLRDLAAALNGSEKQFEVAFDSVTNTIKIETQSSYTLKGGELSLPKQSVAQAAKKSQGELYLDHKKISVPAYTINGNNFYKLRDMGNFLNFSVEWDSQTRQIVIETVKNSEMK